MTNSLILYESPDAIEVTLRDMDENDMYIITAHYNKHELCA